jgi:hypothetical protein
MQVYGILKPVEGQVVEALKDERSVSFIEGTEAVEQKWTYHNVEYSFHIENGDSLPRLEFRPKITPEYGPDIAYKMYKWSLGSYGGPTTIQLEWHSKPQLSYFIGLANWQTEQWDWFALPESNIVTLPSFTQYIDSHGMLLLNVVVSGNVTGSHPVLRLIRIGANEMRAVGGGEFDAELYYQIPTLYPGTLVGSSDLSPMLHPAGGWCTQF